MTDTATNCDRTWNSCRNDFTLRNRATHRRTNQQ